MMKGRKTSDKSNEANETKREIFAALKKCHEIRPPTSPGRYALIGTIPVRDDEAAIERFLELVDKENWAGLVQETSWRGDSDNLEAYVVLSPTVSVLLCLNSRFVPYTEPDIISCKEIKGPVPDLLSTVGWREF